MKRFTKLVEKCGIKTYRIVRVKKNTAELFFIKKKLDMRRIEDTDEVMIAVYKDMEEDGKKLRGRADVNVSSSMTDEEILAKLEGAVYSAGFVKNPYFDLPAKEVSDEICAESTLNEHTLSEDVEIFADAIYSVDTDKEAFINNVELFGEEKQVHIVSSEGTDVSYLNRCIKGEFVAQCKTPQDVETYQEFEYDELSLDEIKELVSNTLSMTKDRAKADRMPKAGTYDVIISDKYMREMVSFYLDRANAAYIYPGYSNFKIGDKVQGEEILGDKVNIKLGVTDPFSEEGIRMVERPLIESGTLKTIHGNERFSHYLGIKPIGNYSKAILEGGNISFEDMKKRKCLHIVNFSDFQMDAMDGHFAGEMRLAYLYDGNGNVEAVTGGSINGNFLNAQKDILLSKETMKLYSYEGPKAMLIKDVAVAGE